MLQPLHGIYHCLELGCAVFTFIAAVPGCLRKPFLFLLPKIVKPTVVVTKRAKSISTTGYPCSALWVVISKMRSAGMRSRVGQYLQSLSVFEVMVGTWLHMSV